MLRTGCERGGPWEREQERSECCFVVNTFYDPTQADWSFLLVPNISAENYHFFVKIFEKKTYEELKWMEKCFQYFECGLLASFLFLSVQFNSVRCWSWSEFKYYRKEKTRRYTEKNTSHPSIVFHLAALLCFDLIYIADQHSSTSLVLARVQSGLLWLFRKNNLAFSKVSPHQSPSSRFLNHPKKVWKIPVLVY